MKPRPGTGDLPPDAALALQAAARTPRDPKDPNARVKAIDRAAARLKSQYPEFFKEHPDDEDQD